MKKTFAILVAALFAGGAIAWYAHEAQPARLAQQMPAFDGRDLEGRPLASKDLQGGVTVVSVFQRKCDSCAREVKHLNELQRLYPEVRMIAMTAESADDARAFQEDHQFQWPVLPGQGDFIARAGVPGSPAQLFFDAHGNLLGHRLGWPVEEDRQAEARAQLDRWMSRMLASGTDAALAG